MSVLSIITINLNNSAGLQRTIKSVVIQLFKSYEFIIIDGGSEDNSVEIIKQNKDRISFWVSEPDNGIYHAMNKGIKKATGDYLLFLNSGDWLVNENVLENVFSEIQTAEILSGDICFYDTKENKIKWEICSPEKVTAKTIFYGYIPHQATFIKKELFEKVGFYREDLKIASDWNFFLEAFLRYQATYKHHKGMISYFNIDGISCNPATKNLPRQEQMQILNKLYPLFVPDYEKLKELEEERKLWESSREYKSYMLLKSVGLIWFGIHLVRVKNYLKRKIWGKQNYIVG